MSSQYIRNENLINLELLG